MAEHPLHGCDLRLVRAGEHFAALKSEIAAVRDEKTRRGQLRSGVHKPTGQRIAQLAGDVVLPLELGVIVGDIAHNLRSALDNLVQQLAILNRADPLEINRQRCFPISLSEKDYLRTRRGVTWRDRCLDQVEEDHRELIDSIQPFIDAEKNDPNRHKLALLAELNNADKHRVTPATLASPTLPGLPRMGPVDTAGLVEVAGVTVMQGMPIMVDGKPQIPSLSSPDVELDDEPELAITFGRFPSQVTISELDQIGSFVDDILREFRVQVFH